MPRQKKTTNVKKNLTTSAERLKTINTLAELVSRHDLAARFGQQFDGNRDLYEVLGYKKNLTFDDFLGAYRRGDIAKRIVDAPPAATWRRKPLISTDELSQHESPFEKAWVELARTRRVYHYMERADKLAGIGQYGCLLIGASDVRREEDLARPMAKLKGIKNILHLTPFMEGNAEIAEIDTDPVSPRFGLPSVYSLNVASTEGDRIASFKKDKQIAVHWSRIIHIAEGLQEDEFLGTPRLKAVFNRLFDVDKIVGGAAEIFWQAAKRIMVLEAKEGFSAIDDDEAMTEQLDELVHGLRRVIDVQGYNVKTLDPTDVKPDEAFRVALALISSATGIPQRILLGSEQGKMASEQDETNWNGIITDRQTNFAEQCILRPFIDRMVLVGVLPPPDEEYTVKWPSLFELSDKEKGQIGILKARAIAQYAGRMGENMQASQMICTIEEFRTEVLNLPPAVPETTVREVELPEPPAPAPPAQAPTQNVILQPPNVQVTYEEPPHVPMRFERDEAGLIVRQVPEIPAEPVIKAQLAQKSETHESGSIIAPGPAGIIVQPSDINVNVLPPKKRHQKFVRDAEGQITKRIPENVD